MLKIGILIDFVRLYFLPLILGNWKVWAFALKKILSQVYLSKGVLGARDRGLE